MLNADYLIQQIALNKTGAIFGPERTHRYVLWRRHGSSMPSGKPYLTVIGLNPSTADEVENDPTVQRCIARSQRLDFGGLIMLNAFALRSTDPKALYKHPDPVGDDNDTWIEVACLVGMGPVVAAWGNHGMLHFRSRILRERLSPLFNLVCLGKNKSGEPKHPLYLKNSEPLIPYP